MSRTILSILVICIFAFNLSHAQRINAVVGLTGSIQNAVTRTPVSVKIVATDENGKIINTVRSNASDNGYYYVAGLKPGQKYKIKVGNIGIPNENAGFLNETFDISVPNTDKYLEISKDLLVKPSISGTKIALKVPPFELNKGKLRNGHEIILSDVLRTITSNPTKKFEIKCYPDKNDESSKNIEITSERAESIKKFLQTSGADITMVEVQGSDSIDPVNPPPTEKAAKGKRYVGTTYLIVK